MTKIDMTVPGYESLAKVLQLAYDQAAKGKGHERHATNRPFSAQPMQTISNLVGSADGLAYQAIKKIQESQRMDHDPAVRELLGAINYLAGLVIWKEDHRGTTGIGSELKIQAQALPGKVNLLNTVAVQQQQHPDFWYCHCRAHQNECSAPIPIGESCPRCHAIQ